MRQSKSGRPAFEFNPIIATDTELTSWHLTLTTTGRMCAQDFDVIVVGVGSMGASVCDHLARRGVRVLGLEQFSVPHDRGSHTGFSRMTRTAYYEHPDYVPLLKRAWQLWRELESKTQITLLHATGGIYFGPPDSEIVARSREAAVQHGLVHEMLDQHAIAARYPQFRMPSDFVALHERDAGFILCERAIDAMVKRARSHGAIIHENEAVLSHREERTGVSVTTDRTTYRADQIVICGGAWADRLVTELGVKLTVTRQVLGWVQPLEPAIFELGTLPVWAIDHLDGTIHYGFPIHPDMPGFKIAHHAPGEPTDPNHVRREVSKKDEDTFRPILERFIPRANGPLLKMATCLYTNSPDHHFIIDRLPRHKRTTVACGFSGHGFKFASVVGEILADLSLDGKTPLPAQFLGFDRFKQM